MRKPVIFILCISMIASLAACNTDSKKTVAIGGDAVADAVKNGVWQASYKETFDYAPLYDKSSPFAASGDNLISGSGFEGCTVGKGDYTVGQWIAMGTWSSAYTVADGVGADNSAALQFKHTEEGKSNSYAAYLLNVEQETDYVLTAKLKSVNLSKPVIKVLAGSDGRLLAQTAGGTDDFFEEVSTQFGSATETQVAVVFIGNATGDNFNETLSGSAFLDDLGVYKMSVGPLADLPHSYRMNDGYSYNSWDGENFSAWKFGISELWWYGNARAFSYNAVSEVYCPDSAFFWIKGRPKSGKTGYFGFEFTWETKLEKGYAYQFRVRMPFSGEEPDIITVNDKIVWTYSYDEKLDEFGNPYLIFEYVPEKDEYARIRFICETGIKRGESTNCGRRILPPPNGNWTEVSLSCKRTANLVVPKYKKYDLHEKTEFTACDSNESARMLREGVYSTLDGDIADIPEVDYPVSDLTVFEDDLNIMYDDSADLIKKMKLDSLAYIPSAEREDTDFEEWAKRASNAGIKNLLLYTVMSEKDLGLSPSSDHYRFTQIYSMVEKSAEALEQGINTTGSLAKRWLELVPDGTVTVCLAEVNSMFGNWDKGIVNSPIKLMTGFEDITLGGVKSWQLAYEFMGDIHKKIKAAAGNSDKVLIMSDSSSGSFNLSHFVKSGDDIIYQKGTNRQCNNIVLSVARGVGNSLGVKYGVAWDTFDRDYWYGITNEAINMGFLSFFHGGISGILNEISVQNKTEKKLNNQAVGWYNGVRYAKTHPAVGKTVVNTAILRGNGDEWNKLAAKTAGWEQGLYFYSQEMNRAITLSDVPTKWAAAAKAYRATGNVTAQDTYLGDFDLLDVIYSDYGTALRTNTQSLFTGTPYGPADIMDDDVPLEVLKRYKTLIYCGRGLGITKQTAQNLEKYVEDGGTLIMAVGQLKDENSKLVTDTFASVELGKSKIVDGLPYTYIRAEKAEIIKRHKNGDPQALFVNYGKGSLALFSGEYLSAYDADTARETIAALLDKNSDVTFSKSAEHIEYTPNLKGKSVILPFINQGRGFYPSGNGKDYGVWRGNVAVDLTSFGLNANEVAVYRAEQKVDGTKPITLSPVKFKTEGNSVIFEIDVALIDEIVIGNKDTVKKDFFS